MPGILVWSLGSRGSMLNQSYIFYDIQHPERILSFSDLSYWLGHSSI